jgi:hypothetical protein
LRNNHNTGGIMICMNNISIQDRITEKDPFPFRWLQKVGVDSKKQATSITLLTSFFLILITLFMYSRLLSEPSVSDETLPPEEALLLEQNP